MAMLEKISLQIFQNADLLNLLIISITVYFLLKLIFRKNRYLTLIYIITAFFILSVYNLGSFKMPSSTYDPEYDNTEIILKASDSFNKIYTISGEGDNNANDGEYQIYYNDILIEGSNDSVHFEEITTLKEKDFFKYEIIESPSYQYLRLTFPSKKSILSEIWLVNDDKYIDISIESYSEGLKYDDVYKIIDEQDTFIKDPSFINETYFDDIYHVRNAYEISNAQKMYTAVHPLLGTEIIALGIKIFGMNPFGYRIMGVVFSSAILLMTYLLVKEFTSHKWAIYGTLLMAFDFMHYTTGRIATLEPFSIFFIMGMFLFMIKATKHNYIHDSRKHYINLLVSGLFMGMAISVKWTGCYAVVGLALIYFIFNIQTFIKEKDYRLRNNRTVELFLLSLIFFIIIPVMIYILSFIIVPMYGTKWHNLNEFIDQVIQYNTYMFNYHTGLESTHPYSSKWYEWLFNIRPIWYYVKRNPDTIMTISCMNNPLINISGVIAIIYGFYQTFIKKNQTFLILLIMYFTNLVPWMFVSRTTFAYHYYPCIPFLILILTYTLYHLSRNNRQFEYLMQAIIILSFILFIIFLPVTGGFETTNFYVQKFLRWLPTWYFG